MKKINFVKKKASKTYFEKNLEKVEIYKKSIENIDRKDLVFIDESGIEKKIAQEYFWTQKGKVKNIQISGKRSSRTNVIAALTDKGIAAQFTFEGSCNTEIFELYIKTVLCPTLRKGKW